MIAHKGFTIIEYLISLAVIGIVAAVVIGSLAANHSNTLSFGFNGVTELRCIDGFKFAVGRDGNARQVLDEFGKGARCD